MKIVVHGGAGKIPQDLQLERQATLDKAADLASSADTPLSAVVDAVKVLEDNPLFNAGYGGSLQLDGEVRLDAAVMRNDLSCGGVINVEKVKHPIEVAMKIMEDSPHILLQCRGATEFAEHYDLVTSEDLRSPKKIEKWKNIVDKLDTLSYKDRLEKLVELAEGHDTVGAVAWDGQSMAAATSTGGITTQMYGRVGDTPIIGSGVYCNEFGGASTTGIGEAIIKVNLARELVYHLEQGEDPQTGAKDSIGKLAEYTNSQAGLIAIDNQGRVGVSHNTRDMQYSVRSS